MIEPLGAVITLRASTQDLSTIGGLLKFVKNAEAKILFPLIICCPMCGDKLEIRGLDDFPYKSKLCECGHFYFIKLVHVGDNGDQKII